MHNAAHGLSTTTGKPKQPGKEPTGTGWIFYPSRASGEATRPMPGPGCDSALFRAISEFLSTFGRRWLFSKKKVTAVDGIGLE